MRMIPAAVWSSQTDDVTDDAFAESVMDGLGLYVDNQLMISV